MRLPLGSYSLTSFCLPASSVNSVAYRTKYLPDSYFASNPSISNSSKYDSIMLLNGVEVSFNVFPTHPYPADPFQPGCQLSWLVRMADLKRKCLLRFALPFTQYQLKYNIDITSVVHLSCKTNLSFCTIIYPRKNICSFSILSLASNSCDPLSLMLQHLHSSFSRQLLYLH